MLLTKSTIKSCAFAVSEVRNHSMEVEVVITAAIKTGASFRLAQYILSRLL